MPILTPSCLLAGASLLSIRKKRQGKKSLDLDKIPIVLRKGTSLTETASSEKVLIKWSEKNFHKSLNFSRSHLIKEGIASVKMGQSNHEDGTA